MASSQSSEINKMDFMMKTNVKSKSGSRFSELVLRVLFGALGCTALLYTGCAMCCGPYDYHYPTHGGAIQRQDPVWGRVGSVFSDPGPLGGPSSDYNLTPHEGGSVSNSFESDEDDLDLEPLNDESNLNPPEGPNGGGSDSRSDADVLPPPQPQGPSPDESTTSVRRWRNQSRRAAPRSRWR